MARNYSTHHSPGTHLSFEDRQMLGSKWNALIESGTMVSIRGFAKRNGIPAETWRREYNRGAENISVPGKTDARMRQYGRYDPFKAQDSIVAGNSNKGTKMLVTNRMAALFRKHVLEEKLSPYDAVCHLRKELPGERIPCVSAWYKHINVGDVGVRYGQTPYHPHRRKNRAAPHPAKTVPGRLQLRDRPAEADRRSQCGHFEMDTIVSSTNGSGGLLVLIDRKSRRYVIERIAHVTQEQVLLALRRMKRRKTIGKILSVTTDNGCEFLDPESIKKTLGCDIYYTRAYASWEKGSIENCNRLVRRWYPKGTDFSLCSNADMHRLERTINSIHRSLFDGKTAYEVDTEYKAVS